MAAVAQLHILLAAVAFAHAAAEELLAVPLNVTVVPLDPFVKIDPSRVGNVAFSGQCIDLFEESMGVANALAASKGFRFTWNYYAVPDGKYGAESPAGSGKWNGAVGEVLGGRAEVALGQITWSASREKVVDFMGPWLSAPIAILVSKPQPQADTWSFTRPFDSELWLSVLCYIIVVSALQITAERISPYSAHAMARRRNDRDLRDKSGLRAAVTSASMVVLGQPPSPDGAPSISGRLLYIMGGLYSLILVANYTAALTAFATIKRAQQPIKSLADLAAARVPWCTLSGASTFTLIQQHPSLSIARMAELAVLASSYPECYSKLQSGEVAGIVGSEPVLRFLGNSPPCNTEVVGTLPSQGFYSFPIPEGWEHGDTLTVALQTTVGNGKAGEIEALWLTNGGLCDGAEGGLGTGALSFADMRGIYLACSILVGVAAFVLLLEKLTFRQRHSRNKWCRRLNKLCGYDYELDALGDADSRPVKSTPRASLDAVAHNPVRVPSPGSAAPAGTTKSSAAGVSASEAVLDFGARSRR